MEILFAVAMATLVCLFISLLIIASGEWVYTQGLQRGNVKWMHVGNVLGWLGGGLILLSLLCGGVAIGFMVGLWAVGGF